MEIKMETTTVTDNRTITEKAGVWYVVVYNDEVHSFDQVIRWLQESCGHNIDTATGMAFTIDREGRAQVFSGQKNKCNAICQFLRSRGLQVEIDTAGGL